MTEHNRVCAEIDLDAIAYNMEQMKKRIGDHARLIAVVKADGYGHGAVPVAGMFEACSYVWGYAVACLEEAMELREQGIRKPILVLGCVFPRCARGKTPLSILRSIQGWGGSGSR